MRLRRCARRCLCAVDLADACDHVLSGHNEPSVDAEVIPRVSGAFRTIARGGDYAVDDGMRRYRFEGFDIIVRADSVRP